MCGRKEGRKEEGRMHTEAKINLHRPILLGFPTQFTSVTAYLLVMIFLQFSMPHQI
jgi:hypothetical protein